MNSSRLSVGWLGIDIGTSRCKAVVLDGGGRLVAQGAADIATRRRPDGEITQRPQDWLRAVAHAGREAVRGAPQVAIEAVALTAPAHVAVLSDMAGTPLTASLLAFDGRPRDAARAIRARYGDDLFRSTYVHLTAGWTLSQLGWLHQQEPSWWSSIHSILPEKDWVRFQMTGASTTDPSDAAGTGLYDQANGMWLNELVEDLGIGRHTLPAVAHAEDPGGAINRAWARRLGVNVGTPVLIGATDTAAELVSVDAMRAGTGLVKVASTGTVVGVSDEPLPDARLMTYPHPYDGLWYTVGATSAATVAYQWFRESVLGRKGREPTYAYAEMDALAARVRAGSDGLVFVPSLQGERTPGWDERARGAFIGLTTAHDVRHLSRAILEGVGFSIRSCRDLLREVGAEPAQIRLTGGGMASRVWRSIIVDIIGTDARIGPEGPALGAALIAAWSTGARDVRSVGPVRSIAHDRAAAQDYDRAYQRFLLAVASARIVDRASHADLQG